MLRCSEWWIKEQARRRRIPFSWIGGSYLFTDEHIAAIVRLFEVQPTEASEPASPTGPVARQRSATDDRPAARLTARPPRRKRNTTSNSATMGTV